MKTPLEERLQNKLVTNPQTGCWEFTGARSVKGYGHIAVNQRCHQAHRVAFEIYSGEPIPAGMFVCHHCDNPPCCNPGHLFLGTNLDNIKDSQAKGRWKNRKSFGIKNWEAVRPVIGTPYNTHCKHGHLKRGENAYVMPNGYIGCKTCRRDQNRKARQERGKFL